MWVYGDQERVTSLKACLADADAALAALRQQQPGLGWHGTCAAVLLRLSELLQGLADEAFQRVGYDRPSAEQDLVMAAAIAAAGALDRSWCSGLADQEPPDLSRLDRLAQADDRVLNVRRCEGYAFYAVYPELFLEAAKALPPGAIVIGLRSIGTGLAALVAVASGAETALTLRPLGEPFDRGIAAGPALLDLVAEHRNRVFVLVDEGPGLSGSSLGGAADWLEGQGVPPDRIVFMPSHSGDLGPQAKAGHRARWNARPRLVAGFEAVMIDGKAPLAGWFEDLIGPRRDALQDISGGAWRALSAFPQAPVDPGREARKYLIETGEGRFLLKFAGLDAAATEKLDRARRLHEAGFSPEPLALRHGFLLQHWVDHQPVESVPCALILRYLSFRAQTFPADAAGASLARLIDMARFNAEQALGERSARLFADWTPARLETLQRLVRPIHVDGRLHRWEWIATASGILKTDAVDHSEAHDLVGCQDVAWDIAGAAVELDLESREIEILADALLPGARRALLDCMIPCYLGFQLGWWSYAGEGGAAQRALYAEKLEALLQA